MSNPSQPPPNRRWDSRLNNYLIYYTKMPDLSPWYRISKLRRHKVCNWVKGQLLRLSNHTRRTRRGGSKQGGERERSWRQRSLINLLLMWSDRKRDTARCGSTLIDWMDRVRVKLRDNRHAIYTWSQTSGHVEKRREIGLFNQRASSPHR